ncbi:MAG: hypothetical protein Crog4KO_35260 [Crocinitomicaceae bacterium]
MTKRLELIITCDDGGLSKGIDNAVMDLFQQGLVSCVSVMPNMPHAQTALEGYQQVHSLEVGAHLVLTEGQPLTLPAKSSSLVKSERFRSREWFLLNALFLSQDSQKIIYNELDAQMQFFMDNGCQPAHITTHHHFHLLPKLRTIIYNLARKYGVKWVRNSTLRGAVIPNNPLINRTNSKARHDFIEPDYIVLVMEWLKKSPQDLLTQLGLLDGLIELVIHPSEPVDDTFPEQILYPAHERSQEVDFIYRLFEITKHTIDVIQIA